MGLELVDRALMLSTLPYRGARMRGNPAHAPAMSAIVARVDASIIRRLVNRAPLCVVDAAPIAGARGVREGTGDFNPAVLKHGHSSDD